MKNKQGWRDLKVIMKLFSSTQPRTLVLGVLMGAMTVICGIVLLGISGWFITATAIAGLAGATAFLLFDVFTPSATIRFLAIARTFSRYGERLITHHATLGVIAKLREQLFRGWAKPEAAKALLQRPAQLLYRLTVDIDALDSLYLRIIVPVSAALIVMVLGALAFSFWLTPALGVALLVWLFVVGIGTPALMALRGFRAARLKSYSAEALRARTVDLVAGQVELLMAGEVERQNASVMRADAFLSKADSQMNKLEIWVSLAHGIATIVAVVGCLLASATMVQAGVLGAPVAVLALLVLLGIFEPFTAIQRGAVELGKTMLAAKRIAPRVAATTDDVSREQQAQQVPHSFVQENEGVVLRINNVSYGYPESSRQVLKNVNLSIASGEKIAIVGPSGSGKSTLLSLIMRELMPDEGTIDVGRYSVLSQRTELFQDTIRDNLLLANAKATDEMLWDALYSAGLAETVRAMPAQLDTWLGEGGLGLSGGQARRLALARLLLRDAPFWILDEPTEGLDAQTAADVLDRVFKVGETKAMLIATHLQREAENADSIVVIDGSQGMECFERSSSAYLSVLSQLNPK